MNATLAVWKMHYSPASTLDLKRESAEVYYASGTVRQADAGVIDFLRTEAKRSARRRCRLCLHTAPDAAQQEMLIVMHRDSYVAPHKHRGKDETLLVIEGSAQAPIFGEEGDVIDVIALGAPASNRTFFYHMPEGVYHGLAIETEWLVYVETTIGPFRRDATIFPSWAPAEGDHEAQSRFKDRIAHAIAATTRR